ncbi:hypothetical protein AB0910_09480 [Streptomyces sp. NPDC047002]|uniref:hypothetical protein n=1 Tax=Streptomyces sp. NPDC047002 TaxID=3155475 RepID=UPI0034567C98
MSARHPDHPADAEERLDTVLGELHTHLGIAVGDRLNAAGGPPELRTPDLALDRLLGAAHRALGGAVEGRLKADYGSVLELHPTRAQARLSREGPLARRSPAARIKHREEALRLVRAYWPADLAKAVRPLLVRAQRIGEIADATRQVDKVIEAMVELRNELAPLSRLLAPARLPALPADLNYLDAVEQHLARPADALAQSLLRILECLDDELVVHVDRPGASDEEALISMECTVEDLTDDLAHACSAADLLARAVGHVQNASNDFIGADLSAAKLDDVVLEGVMWDATTRWPAQWESRVSRASLTSDYAEGVRVIQGERADSIASAQS